MKEVLPSGRELEFASKNLYPCLQTSQYQRLTIIGIIFL